MKLDAYGFISFLEEVKHLPVKSIGREVVRILYHTALSTNLEVGPLLREPTSREWETLISDTLFCDMETLTVSEELQEDEEDQEIVCSPDDPSVATP